MREFTTEITDSAETTEIMEIAPKTVGHYTCPKCRTMFHTETELQDHFDKNIECKILAKQMLNAIKYGVDIYAGEV